MNIQNIARQMQLTNAANQLTAMAKTASEITSDTDTLAQTKACIANLETQLTALKSAINQ